MRDSARSPNRPAPGVRIGLRIDPAGRGPRREGRADPDPTSLVELASAGERRGFAAVWVAEPRGSTPAGIFPLCAAIAAVTGCVRIMAAVGDPSRLHPVRLAEDVASLDGISAGRIEVALDAPGPEGDARRWHDLDDRLERLFGAWGHVPSGGVDVRPKPVQRPHPPVWIRCGAPGALPSGPPAGDGIWLASFEATLAPPGDAPDGEPAGRFGRLAVELPIAEIDRRVARIASAASSQALDLILPVDPDRPEPAFRALDRLRERLTSPQSAATSARPDA